MMLKVLALMVAALMAVATIEASPAPVSFRRDILPVFVKECAYCHLKEGPDAGLILEPRVAYLMIVNVPSSETAMKRVDPGYPEQSYLLLKMQNRHRLAGGTGSKMPPGWLTATPAEITLVRAWIAAGALDN
jgi:hypothetical protein